MFGAWQAGAWRALARTFRPDLVVGASVGSLNGYAIAAGWSADELCAWWRRSPLEGIPLGFSHLPVMTQALVAARPLEREYAAVLTNLLRMKPQTFAGREVTARHLVASCAVPGAFHPQRIGGNWYLDGGLLNPLPVWAAVDLGATHVVALNALPEIPLALLKPFVKAFRAVFGHNPPLPLGVKLITVVPSRRLGSMGDALRWRRHNIVRWLEQGTADAENISTLHCFE